MKAMVFRGKGELVSEEYSLPPLPTGWVRIEVKATGICGSDLHKLNKGYYESPGDLEGHILGHENAGVVVERGSGVERIGVGQRVAVMPWITCRTCTWCRSGQYVHCPRAGIIGYQYAGGFAQYLDAPETSVYLVPDTVSLVDACQLDPAACGVHALALSRIKPVDSVVVIGDGAIGLFALQAAALGNPRQLIAVGRHQVNLGLAQRWGATDLISLVDTDPVEAVRSLTQGEGARVIIEAVGRRTDTVAQALQMVAPTGTVVVMGVFTEPRPVPLDIVLQKGIRVVGSPVYGYWDDADEFQLTLDLLQRGKIEVAPLITHILAVDDIKEGVRLFTHKQESHAIKIILQGSA